MKTHKKSPRNLMVVEADRDLVRLIHSHARKNNLKVYGVVSDLLRIGLKVKRLLPSRDNDTQPQSELQS